MTKKVLVIILNYLTYKLTIDLIEDLNNLNVDLFDILVIDNNSPNESASILERESKRNNFVFIGNKINNGYAAGNNIGLRYAYTHNYKYSLILNNDVKINDKNIIELLISDLENNKKIGAVGPRIVDLEGNAIAPYVNRPNIWNMTLGISRDKKVRNSNIYISRYVYRLFGCCLLVNNAVMNQIDYFDERTFLYQEENILAEKMRNIGYKMYYDSEVSIIHMESSTINSSGFGKNTKKRKILEDSTKIYLKNYRGYNNLYLYLCIYTRNLINIIKEGMRK